MINSSRTNTRLVVVGLALVLLIAIFLRVWRLDSVPRGLSHDEANNALMAGEVVKGKHAVFFEIYTGVEPGLIYPQALAFWLFGSGATTERLVSVVFGVLTVALSYFFAVRLFKSRLVGLLTALLVAISFWHVFVSRLALRAVVMPPLQILTLLFYWRGLEGHRQRDFVLAGLFGGLTMYTYLSSRFLPFVPVVFVLYLLIRRERLRDVWAGLGLMVVVWLLVFLPLGIYYLRNPDWFLYRGEQALILTRSSADGGLVRLMKEMLATLGMFSFAGDPSWRYNVAGRPVFDWVMALAFYAGLALSLFRSVKRPKLNPYAFLLITQVIMLVPDFITDGSPHFLRTIGTIPTTFIFPAIALERLFLLVSSRRRWVVVVLFGAWGIFAGYSAYHDYFRVWAQNPEAREIYNASLAEMADILQQRRDEGAVYIASTSPDLDRVAFNQAVGDEPPPALWFDGTQALVIPGHDRQQGHYFLPTTVAMPPYLRDLLPEGEVQQFLAPDGSVSFEIRSVASSAIPQSSIGAVLGEQVDLLGYDMLSPRPQAGQPLELYLHWQVTTNPDPRRRWAWFVHLVDDRGYEWANWSGQGLEVADWRIADHVIQRVRLDIPFDAPDIAYHLEIGVFDRNDGERLRASDGSDRVVVEGIRVMPTDANDVEGIIARHRKGQLGAELAFLGSALGVEQLSPGADLTLALVWSPDMVPSGDYDFRMQLVGEDGSIVHEVAWSPLDGEYPTSRWPAGRIIRDVLTLTIPPEVPPGRVALVVSAEGLPGKVRVGELQIVP